jgi:hypothetical protein
MGLRRTTPSAPIFIAESRAVRSSGASSSPIIEVGGASFADGLLEIALNRIIPEARKPRKIEIGSNAGERQRIEAPKDNALESA